jgi:hypothetical protein
MAPEEHEKYQRDYLDDVLEQLDKDYQGGLDNKGKRKLIRFYASIYLNGNEPIPERVVEDYLRGHGLSE